MAKTGSELVAQTVLEFQHELMAQTVLEFQQGAFQ